MNRYLVLLRVLDQLRDEAPPSFKTYHPDIQDIERLNAARSRAFIHLLLKVYFGVLDFHEREHLITEGSNDGGIDAYFIDTTLKKIYFIQSKFRQTERNFEEKAIDPEELLRMDISRILNGETTTEAGVTYNPRVLATARRIRDIEDIGRYEYRVIILANAKGVTRQKLTLLTGGFTTELIDYQECYTRLLFPLVSGTYHIAEELHLSLTLSNKNAGAKISYSVVTEYARVEITVVFVPTLEIAKAMHKYRNSILKYNPRSFLEHEGQSVNREIRRSIEDRSSNEFALFNNGITMLSDETYLNERIGQKDRAQLTVVNPQIINGGQTAYTLSQILRDHPNDRVGEVFGEKEVLVKILTFDSGAGLSEERKLSLIEDISRATNSQTAVTNADRRSNEPELKALQRKSFERSGIFVERKRGEFADGVREGYLDAATVVDRNLFLRAAMIAQGRIDQAGSKKIAARCDFRSVLEVPDEVFDAYKIALVLLQRIHLGDGPQRRRIGLSTTTKAYVALLVAKRTNVNTADTQAIAAIADRVIKRWRAFVQYGGNTKEASPFVHINKRGERYLSVEPFLKTKDGKEEALSFFTSSDDSSDNAGTEDECSQRLSGQAERLANLLAARDKAMGALDRIRQNIDANRVRLNEARSVKFAEQVSRWINVDEDNVREIEQSMEKLDEKIKEAEKPLKK